MTRSALELKFWKFHLANPHVYDLLVRMARQWTARHSDKRLGIKALFERVRWEYAITISGDDFKLNNVFTAFYARLLMHQEQDFYDLFELRSQTHPFTYQQPTPDELNAITDDDRS